MSMLILKCLSIKLLDSVAHVCSTISTSESLSSQYKSTPQKNNE